MMEQENIQLTWPPPYRLVMSTRAKRLQLKVDRDAGLQVVCPTGVTEASALQFLLSQRAWIEKNWALIAAANRPFVWPDHVLLPAFEQKWQLQYTIGLSKSRMQSKRGHVLYCAMPSRDSDLFRSLLKRWLARTAKALMTPVIERLSAEHALPFNRLSIRYQKTRWGACSSNKDITLNAKLLFYPYPVMHYVMIHELCHTVHMNHSKSFWRLVSDYSPDYRQYMKVLNQPHGLPDFLHG